MNFNKPKFWDIQKISFWSILLLPFSFVYLVICFVSSVFKIKKKFSIPVVCIGNIYLGGTGKTPLARRIFNIVKSMDKNPAFIKKYYKYLQDEIKILEETGKIFLCKNRQKGIITASTNRYDVAILDDGFQDLSIKSNFSILCFNSKQSYGNGFVIPSGPLREPLSAVSRADCIIINGSKNLKLEDKLKYTLGQKKLPIFYSKYKIHNIEKFKNKKIVAFAGIGNPSNFFDLLMENNLDLVKSYSFPDHYDYVQKDFDKIKKDRSMTIVTTEKDYYRISDQHKQNLDYIKVSLEIENENNFKDLIKKHL